MPTHYHSDTAMETTVDTTTEATVNNTATVAAENHVAIVNASNDDKWVDLQCHDWWKLQPHLKQKVGLTCNVAIHIHIQWNLS